MWIPPLGCQKETTPHMKVWVQSGEKKSDFWHIVFITGCLFYQQFLFVAVCFTRNRTNMFSGIWKSEKKLCHLHGSRFPLLRQSWVLARFYSLFLSAVFPPATRHFYHDVMSSNVPHLVSVPEGEHVPPQDNSGLQHGAFLSFSFFSLDKR